MITPDGIEMLNAAKRILEREDKTAMSEAWGKEGPDGARLGRVAEAAGTAADAIFNFLNVASNYGGVEMTHEQLHGRPEEVEANA